MKTKEIIKNLKILTIIWIGILLLLIAATGAFLLWKFSSEKFCPDGKYAYFFWTGTGLIISFLLLIILVLWTYNLRLKQLHEHDYNREENEDKRKHEKEQAKLNQEYRLEALKRDKVQQKKK